MVEKKFKALRFVSGLFKILAWIVLVLGILGALGVLIAGIAGTAATNLLPGNSTAANLLESGGGIIAGILGFITIIIFALIQFVVLKAVSELWELFISVEHNTRTTAYYVSGGQQGSDPNMVAPPPVQ